LGFGQVLAVFLVSRKKRGTPLMRNEKSTQPREIFSSALISPLFCVSHSSARKSGRMKSLRVLSSL
jgi:hypothetical protein